jgi:hypothetical protein
MKIQRIVASGLVFLSCLGFAATAQADEGSSGGGDQTAVQAHSNDVGRTGGLFADSSFEMATGADYSVGHYGAALDTTVWSIPLDLKAQLGRLRLQASLPYEFIDGPGQLVGVWWFPHPAPPPPRRVRVSVTLTCRRPTC